MKVLVDNVAVQAIEACLMTHLPDIISPASVVQMEDDVIIRIAAEPEENQALREQLTRKLAVLKGMSPTHPNGNHLIKTKHADIGIRNRRPKHLQSIYRTPNRHKCQYG